MSGEVPAEQQALYDVLRTDQELRNAPLALLREVWAALGCAPNPEDYHVSTQRRMWIHAIEQIDEYTRGATRLHRRNQGLEEALAESQRRLRLVEEVIVPWSPRASRKIRLALLGREA